MIIKEKIDRVFDMFETSFIHKKDELILHKKWNVYFRLPDIETVEQFDYKILSYCSYYVASNHFKKSSPQCKYFWRILNRWFRRDFTYEELQIMYCKLGCGANKDLGVKFIELGLDMKVLKEQN